MSLEYQPRTALCQRHWQGLQHRLAILTVPTRVPPFLLPSSLELSWCCVLWMPDGQCRCVLSSCRGPNGKRLCAARRDYGGAARPVVSKRTERALMDAKAGLLASGVSPDGSHPPGAIKSAATTPSAAISDSRNALLPSSTGCVDPTSDAAITPRTDAFAIKLPAIPASRRLRNSHPRSSLGAPSLHHPLASDAQFLSTTPVAHTSAVPGAVPTGVASHATGENGPSATPSAGTTPSVGWKPASAARILPGVLEYGANDTFDDVSEFGGSSHAASPPEQAYQSQRPSVGALVGTPDHGQKEGPPSKALPSSQDVPDAACHLARQCPRDAQAKQPNTALPALAMDGPGATDVSSAAACPTAACPPAAGGGSSDERVVVQGAPMARSASRPASIIDAPATCGSDQGPMSPCCGAAVAKTVPTTCRTPAPTPTFCALPLSSPQKAVAIEHSVPPVGSQEGLQKAVQELAAMLWKRMVCPRLLPLCAQ